MRINKAFEEIISHSHFWNWAPDWGVVKEIYKAFPDSYSVLTPFAYTYLEELIRSTTSEYGMELIDEHGDIKKYRKVGVRLINLAIEENKPNNQEFIKLLGEIKSYFSLSKSNDQGDNRNSVAHGYMHPRYWNKDSFEKLIKDIAKLSKYSGF